jgi:hypothetical protein
MLGGHEEIYYYRFLLWGPPRWDVQIESITMQGGIP